MLQTKAAFISDLSELQAAVDVELKRLGLSKEGLTIRLLLKTAGLPRWHQLDPSGYELALKILKSAQPERSFVELSDRCARLEDDLHSLITRFLDLGLIEY
jgi:hypothetical protein